MAISAILQVDTYVANRYRETNGFCEFRWSRIRSSHTLTEPKHCIYISDYDSHYTPVCKMINSATKKYF